ncbi:MAG: serine hydrolase [Patescibacteria group bacterium]
MSNITRFHMLLAGTTLLTAVAILISWPFSVSKASATSVAASAFCANVSPKLELTGEAAYAEDLKTGKVLYEKNANIQLPLASITKLMTILVASETLKESDTVSISQEALEPEGDAGLHEGETWHVKNLIDFTLVTSANDGAHALALASELKAQDQSKTFIDRMNAKATELGLLQTFFADDTGLDISPNNAGAYGSARDVGKLFAYVARTNPRLIEGTTVGANTFTSLDGRAHEGKNTSTVITELSGAIGSKTGFTDLAGGNLGVIFEPLPGRPVVAVILGSTRDGRDTDMLTLAKNLRATLRRAIVCEMGK